MASKTPKSSKNLDTIMRVHSFFNSRRLQECVDEFADNGVYHDLPRGKDWSKADFLDFLQGWTQAFSDCQITDAKYIDAGDVVVVEFKARGKNDGPLGTFSPTNKKIDLPYCEVFRFDKEGKIQQVNAYYDLLGMFSQLGHLEMPSEAEISPPATH